METQDITLSLPKEILRRVKHIAVERQTSVSRLMTELLVELVQREDACAQARERQLAMMAHGFNLGTGGKATWTRDELHER